MKYVTKWRIEAKYHRGESGASSYSFTITLKNIYDAVVKYTASEEMKNIDIPNYLTEFVYELAMHKAIEVDMAKTYPLMSVTIRETS